MFIRTKKDCYFNIDIKVTKKDTCTTTEYLVFDQERPVGKMFYDDYKDSKTTSIGNIYIESDFRNKGLGSALLSLCEFNSRSNSKNKIFGKFNGDKNAREFYFRNGFSFDDTYFYGEYIEKDLTKSGYIAKHFIVAETSPVLQNGNSDFSK